MPAPMHDAYGLAAALLPFCLLGLYLAVASREPAWSRGRMCSFAAGTALVAVALSPPLAHWAHQDLRGHMVQHLLLGMFAPLGLVLGAPGTLLLRHLPVSAARRIVALLARKPIRALIHPVTAAVLDIGGMYLLYLTPLFSVMGAHPALHLLVHLHFVLSGYLFTWAIAGPDPAPHRPGFPTRLVVFFLAMAAHATLGKLMYGYAYPRTSAPLAEVQQAAQWMYYGGDVAELLLAAALFALWFRQPRPAFRTPSTPA